MKFYLHALTDLLTYWLTYLLTYLLIYLLIHSLTCWLSRSLPHSLTHSLIYSLTHFHKRLYAYLEESWSTRSKVPSQPVTCTLYWHPKFQSVLQDDQIFSNYEPKCLNKYTECPKRLCEWQVFPIEGQIGIRGAFGLYKVIFWGHSVRDLLVTLSLENLRSRDKYTTRIKYAWISRSDKQLGVDAIRDQPADASSSSKIRHPKREIKENFGLLGHAFIT